MDRIGGWSTIAVSAALFLGAAFPLRGRLGPRAIDVMVASGGAGLAVGGLLLLDDVGVASWIVAPLVLAGAGVVHVRVFFAGDGPLRT
jgi:hypothetical protein